MFAKLFEVEDTQALYTTNYDDSDEECPYYLGVRCDYKGVSATYKLKYKEEETMLQQFEGLNQASAETTLSSLKSMVTE